MQGHAEPRLRRTRNALVDQLAEAASAAGWGYRASRPHPRRDPITVTGRTRPWVFDIARAGAVVKDGGVHDDEDLDSGDADTAATAVIARLRARDHELAMNAEAAWNALTW